MADIYRTVNNPLGKCRFLFLGLIASIALIPSMDYEKKSWLLIKSEIKLTVKTLSKLKYYMI